MQRYIYTEDGAHAYGYGGRHDHVDEQVRLGLRGDVLLQLRSMPASRLHAQTSPSQFQARNVAIVARRAATGSAVGSEIFSAAINIGYQPSKWGLGPISGLDEGW